MNRFENTTALLEQIKELEEQIINANTEFESYEEKLLLYELKKELSKIQRMVVGIPCPTEEKGIETLSAWLEIKRRIDETSNMLDTQSLEQLSFEKWLAGQRDYEIQFAIANNPYHWSRAKEYIHTIKKERIVATVFSNETERK